MIAGNLARRERGIRRHALDVALFDAREACRRPRRPAVLRVPLLMLHHPIADDVARRRGSEPRIVFECEIAPIAPRTLERKDEPLLRWRRRGAKVTSFTSTDLLAVEPHLGAADDAARGIGGDVECELLSAQRSDAAEDRESRRPTRGRR